MSPHRVIRSCVPVLIATLALVGWQGTAAQASSSWTIYHGNTAHTGNDTTEPALLPLSLIHI